MFLHYSNLLDRTAFFVIGLVCRKHNDFCGTFFSVLSASAGPSEIDPQSTQAPPFSCHNRALDNFKPQLDGELVHTILALYNYHPFPKTLVTWWTCITTVISPYLFPLSSRMDDREPSVMVVGGKQNCLPLVVGFPPLSLYNRSMLSALPVRQEPVPVI